MWSGQFVSESFYSACVQDYCEGKSADFIETWRYDSPPNYQSEARTFGGDPVPDADSGSLFDVPQHCRCGIGDNTISHTVTDRFSRHSVKMTDAEKLINPHFGNDPADIQIRIRINLEIWIWIPDYFRLTEVCALWAQSNLDLIWSWADIDTPYSHSDKYKQCMGLCSCRNTNTHASRQ